MTVLSPLFLLALAVLAVPILIHLLRRRESRTLDFPALRYLARTTREQARIIRLRQILLLALRLGALTLIVLAAARLVLPLGGRDHPPAGLAIVIDNGLSSSAIIGTGRVLDSLAARASEALDRTGAQDLVWIVAAGEPWSPSVPMTPDQARDRIAGLGSTDVTADLEASLHRAGALLDAGAPDIREIVLVSDRQEVPTIFSGDVAAPRPVPVRVAPTPTGAPTNRGIERVMLSGGLTPRAGDAGEVQVRLSGSNVEGALVRAYLGEVLVGTSRAGSDGLAEITLPTIESGWVRGRIEIDPDDLRSDDAAYFAFLAVPAPGVEVIGSVSPYLEDALQVLADAGRIRLDSEDGMNLRIFAAGMELLAGDTVPILLIPPDDPARLPALNLLLERIAPGWRIEAEGAVDEGDRLLAGGSLLSLLPTLPRIRLAHRIESTALSRESIPLLTLSDDRPWLLRIRGTGGPIFILASPLTLAASDLPASAAMIPLVDALTTMASGTREPAGVLAGDPVEVPENARSVRLPNGSTRVLSGGSVFTGTGTAGIYEFLDAIGESVGFVAVNVRTPGTTSPLEAGPAEGGRPWPDIVLTDRTGREVWRALVAALFLVLVAEGWLAAYGHGIRMRGDDA